jgi:THO complex subunit 4
MDKTLDDIIASRPKPARKTSSRRGVGRAEALGKKEPAAPARARYSTTTPGTGKPTPASSQTTEKIIVSNLPMDVNEAQVKELFHSTIGPLKDATLHYDANGRSKGVANISFTRKGDGSKAYQQYNNRLIDGS